MKYLTDFRNFRSLKSHFIKIVDKVLLAAISTALTLLTISLIVSGLRQLNAKRSLFPETVITTIPRLSAWILYTIIAVSITCLAIIIVYNLWCRFQARRVPLLLTFVSIITFAASQFIPNELCELLSSTGLLCSLVFLLWPRAPKHRPQLDDQLHRSFFANRIADMLTGKNPPLRRIAITGSWGEGKTHLLRLIDSRLKEKGRLSHNSHRIETIWVNPWKASTQTEALQIFAAAFDRLHSIPSIRVIIKRAIPLLKSTSSLAPESKFGNLVLEAISSHYPKESKLDLDQIDQTLEMRRIRLVVFVDDMERADPSAVRGILPVIDKLTELQNCYFVFGIDRDRIEDAFIHLGGASRLHVSLAEEKKPQSLNEYNHSKSKNYVSGFLDKVMDLQLELPDCSEIELNKLAESIINKTKSANPKLQKAFTSIRPFLPRNPRTCKKFLNLAIQTEILYFADYADEDRDFAAVFLVLIGESEFPGYRKFLADDLTWASFSRLELMDEAEGTDAAGEERRSFISRICAKLEIPSDKQHPDFQKIESLHSAIYERVGERGFLYSGKYESPRWVTNDFMARRELSPSEMTEVTREWYEDSSERSFDKIIEYKFGAEAPSDLPSTIYQILTGEIDKYAKKLANFRRSDQMSNPEENDIVSSTLSFLTRLENHFSSRQLSDTEKTVINYAERDVDGINPVIFERLLDMIKAFPISEDSEGEKLEIRSSRINAMSSILKRLELSSQGRFLSDLELRLYSNLGMYERDESVISEINEVSERLKEQLAEIFVGCICSEELDSFVSPTRNEQFNPFIIYEPQRWLPKLKDGSSHYDLSKIESLGPQMHKSKILADNIFKATKRYFIGLCYNLSNLNADNAEWMHHLKNLTNKPGGNSYIRSFWSLALQDPLNERREELLQLRTQAYNFFEKQDRELPAEKPKSNNLLDKNNLLLSVSTFDSCFPTEQTATRPR